MPQQQIRQVQDDWERERQTMRPVIDEEAVAFIVGRWTGIPVTRLQEAEAARLLRMEDELHASVIGQDEAVAKGTSFQEVGGLIYPGLPFRMSASPPRIASPAPMLGEG